MTSLVLLAPAAAAADPGGPLDPRGAALWSPRALADLPSVHGRPAPKARPVAPAGDRAPRWRPGRTRWPAAATTETRLAPPAAGARTPRSVPLSVSTVPGAKPAPGTAGTGNGPAGGATPATGRFAPPTGGASKAGPAGTGSTAGNGPEAGDVSKAGSGAAASGARVGIAVADRAAALRAGVEGLLVSVTPRDADAAGRIRVSLDYTTIRDAYGGGWATRMQLVALPACALTTPQLARCRTRTPVRGARNLLRSGRLTAEVILAAPGRAPAALNTAPGRTPASPAASASASVSASATVLAATAAPAGSAGDFTATSLSPTGSWSAGGNSGSFHWSYPVTLPPALGGTAPSVTLTYDSATIDGRTVSRNAQASWIGDGWDYSPGYVERAYPDCKGDGKDGTGEACWSGKQVVTMSLNGVHTTLLQDDATKQWHTSDGSRNRVELAKLPAGVANGDDDGEYWKITTTDGTQYYFGAQLKPGTSTGTGSGSTWTRPVFANNAGEPCHRTDFAQAWCQQAWRWNLDYVVDTRGSLTTYAYAQESNHYARNPDTAHPDGTLTPYIRGGTLTEIGYGSRLADTGGPTARVLFTSAERCDPAVNAQADCSKPPTKATAAAWPDVPFDQNCDAGTPVKDCKNYSPTFWSTKRLAKITTQVVSGGTPATVDEFTLTHQFPSPQDGTTASLWLASVARKAFDGAASLDQPSTDFAGQFLPNRVDTAADNRPPLNRRRMTAITTESGLRIAVDYAAPDCAAGQFPAPDANTRRCQPVFWNPDAGTSMDPTLDWFHKYVVAGISEVDATSAGAGPSPTRTTRYEYVGGAAWHRDDSELTQAKSRTWNEFRGYGEVIERRGNTQANPVDKTTQTSTVYLRGMDGDYKADGTRRAVAVPGGSVPDADPLAGFGRESRTYSGDGGTLTSVTVSEPWTGPVAARHARGGGLPDLTAQLARTAKATTRSLLSNGSWRTTSQSTTFDAASGRPLTVLDTAQGLPDYCTRTAYASHPGANILDLPTETVSVVGDCSTAPGAATTYSHTRTLYDGLPFGQVGTVGTATTRQVVDAYDGSAPSHTLDTVTEFDAHGRPVKEVDPLGNATTTAYTPATGSPPVKVAVTGPMGAGWTTTVEYATARNLPVKTTDANNRVTEVAYDPAGRVTRVWRPGRNRATQTPNAEFSYALNKSAPSVVTTRTLRDDGAYQTDYKILNAFLEVRQTQAAPVDESPGRILTDTFYDSLGRVVKTNEAYWDKSAGPSGSRFLANDTEIPAQKGVFYDGQGRKTAETTSAHAVELWRTSTIYGGSDRVTTVPPDGGTATTVVSDARGRTAELRQYKKHSDAGGDDPGTFTATSYAYDPRGQLSTVKDAVRNTWTYEYDLLGRRTAEVDPDRGRSETHYDAAGRVAWTKDARGQVLHSTYDKMSRKTASYKDSVTDDNLLATWSYDRLARGQADGSTRYTGGRNGAAYTSQITALDTSYRPLGTKITVPAAEGKLAGTYTTATAYTPVTGKPVSKTLPAIGGLPAETVTTGLSDNGLPVTLWSEEANYVNRTTYDPFGRVRRAVYGDVPRQVAYTPRYDEATGRLTGTFLDRQSAPGDTQVTGSVDATSYTYRPSGSVTSISTRRDDGPAGFTTDTQCFTYDHLQRMTEAWTDKGTAAPDPARPAGSVGGCATAAPSAASIGGPAPYWQSYTFDVTGNRTKLVDHGATGATDVTTAYTSPAPGTSRPHSVTSTTATGPSGTSSGTYDHDAAGRTTARPVPGGSQTLAWDPEGRLAANSTTIGGAVASTSTYLYDADGSRLLRRDPDKVTLYLGTDELTFTRAGQKVAGTRYYKGPDGAPTIIRTVDASGANKLVYQASDHHGTGTTTLDAATLAVGRRDLKPYGEDRGTRPASWPDDKGFLGKPQDATGLTHIGAREYDPALGRFISVDPLMDLADPQQMHGYAYAHNAPVSSSDPTGLIDPDCWRGLCGPPPPKYCGNVQVCNDGPGGQTTTPPTAPTAPPVAPGADEYQDARKAGWGKIPKGGKRVSIGNGVPGTDYGIIMIRFFIHDDVAPLAQLRGDDRGFTTDPEAGSRMVVFVNTATGEATFTVSESISANGKMVNAVEGTFSLLTGGGTDRYDGHIDARPIVVGPTKDRHGEWKNYIDPSIEKNGDALKISVDVAGINSRWPCCAADARVSVELRGDNSVVTRSGDPYPDMEVVQYRPGTLPNVLATDYMASSSGMDSMPKWPGHGSSLWVNGQRY
ncbi:RHS repeat-associated core domain-containing protein [Streptomyces sp. NBC_00239]|uniref:RHS repeat-associated core domain-containing protein n=2 Tax=Actinomycetes TaxID=1760 RepID=UPI002E2DEE12|nr:RHS repeat-associated core domain-containing protein [Streptomyces sp. NBC_00239]